MFIEIINIDGPNKVPGKKYEVIEVTYRKDGKVEGKKLMSFANPALFKQAGNWQPKEGYEITTQKDDNGYWQWIKAEAADVAAAGEAKKSVNDIKKTSEDRYETKEERLARQGYIIRQSSISSAVAMLSVGAKSALKTEDVLAVADELVAYVFGQAEPIPEIIDEEQVPL